MNATRFDRLTRGLSTTPTRRAILGGFATAIGLAAPRVPGRVEAKTKKKPLKVNEFGCVNVGGKCRGKDGKCCSGICKGKKPKKGEKDKSRCVDHHTGGCQADQDQCSTGFSECGTGGLCYRTTGKASFCGAYQVEWFSPCTPCEKDADCTADFGPGAACIDCLSDCPSPGTACLPAAV